MTDTIEALAQNLRVRATKYEDYQALKERIDHVANIDRRNFPNTVFKLLELGLEQWEILNKPEGEED